MTQSSLGIIVPSLNEANNIQQLLFKIIHTLKSVDYTICVVDDGSTDQTIPIVKALATGNDHIHLIQRVKTKMGCQRGGASRFALEWLINNTHHDLFVEIDADGAHQPEELLDGLTYHGFLGFDIVIASKYVYGSKVIGRSWSRRCISLCYSYLARLLIKHTIRDFSNSFRFYSRPAAMCLLKINPRYTSPIYLLEMLTTWITNNFRIIEVPTMYIERNAGHSKVKFIDLIKGFLGMLFIAVRYHCGKYRLQRSVISGFKE